MYLISLVPFPVLYVLSDLLRFIIFFLFRYRRRVVADNLRRVFPNVPEQERNRIAWKFYQNFCDLLLETVKSLTLHPEDIIKRCRIINLEVLERHRLAERSVVAVLGHYCNWEWAALCSALQIRQQVAVIYKPLSNVHFDRLFARLRTRFGLTLIPMSQVPRYYAANRNAVFVNCFVTDQAPHHVDHAYWLDFLGVETGVQQGPEKFAKKYNHPVIFVALRRIRRGYYSVELMDLVEHPHEAPMEAITQAHVKALENLIREAPENWLWSHKRWKRKRNA